MKTRIVSASELHERDILRARDYFPKEPGENRYPPIPLSAVRRLLEYSFRVVERYDDLAPEVREFISPEQFAKLRLWLFGDGNNAGRELSAENTTLQARPDPR